MLYFKRRPKFESLENLFMRKGIHQVLVRSNSGTHCGGAVCTGSEDVRKLLKLVF